MDELGSGTDPNEGAALAQALIECLLTQDARGVITSHLSPLKLFALETPGLKNASMGFEVDTLAPTFHLQVGQPGRSYALAIAERMGLPRDVLARAESILGTDAGLMERMLEGLERERTDLAREQCELDGECDADGQRDQDDGDDGGAGLEGALPHELLPLEVSGEQIDEEPLDGADAEHELLAHGLE